MGQKIGVDWSVINMMCSLDFLRMAVLWPLYLLYSYFLLFFSSFPSFFTNHSSRSHPRCRFSPGPELARPICIVTGPTSGLGLAAVRAFSAYGYHVILVGRSSQRLDQTIREIKERDGQAYLDAFQVDMASVDSIMKFESSFKKWLSDSNLHPSVQLLVNNAGILAASSRVTCDGYDEMMETNYISAFFLTNLLLPLLKNSPVPSRVVNVTSFTHRSAFHADVDKKSLICLATTGKYPFARIYEYSKLCILLFTYELHQKLRVIQSSSTISVNVADPGAVETSIMRELPSCLSQVAFTALKCLHLLQSPEGGIQSILDAALAPPEVSGKLFFGGKGRTIESSSLSNDSKLAEDLWSTSNLLFQESVLRKRD